MDNDSDWISAERNHEFRMAKEINEAMKVRRHEITERVKMVSVTFGIVAVVLAIVSAIYFTVDRSSVRLQEQELACVQAGGTWTSIGGGSSVCVRIAGVDVSSRG